MSRESPVWLYDSTPVLISGATGAGSDMGGKSTLAQWWSYQLVRKGHFDTVIAFDAKGATKYGAVVGGYEQASSALASGENRVTVRPGTTGSELEEAHEETAQFVKAYPKKTVFIHDDAIMYVGDSLQNSIAVYGNMDPPVKNIVISQDPWDLPRRGILSNLTVKIWVGPFTSEAERYFDVMKIDGKEAVREKHTKPHVWTAVNGSEVTTFRPIDPGVLP